MFSVAIRGRMGSIDYYLAKLRANQLTGQARPASELQNWGQLKMEERIQRELEYRRVREEIVPYLLNSGDRFFSSVLVLVRDPEVFDFQVLEEVAKDVPFALKDALKDVGLLTIDGGQFIVLDGQHRYAALRMVVQGQDDQQKQVNGPFREEVTQDEISVIFVSLDVETTRRVFSKINRNAKSVSKADNIIISEDDGYAIVTRRLLDSGAPLGFTDDKDQLLVNWKSTSIKKNECSFSTITTIYETVKSILKSEGISDFDEASKIVKPAPSELDQAYEIAANWWTTILTGPDCFETLLSSPELLAERRNSPDDPLSLLLRPAMQQVLVKALIKARDRGLELAESAKRLDLVDWRLSSPIWQNLLVTPAGKIISRKENYELASELLSYLLAADVTEKVIRDEIERRIAEFLGKDAAVDYPDERSDDIYELPEAPSFP